MVCNTPYSINRQTSMYIINSVNNQIITHCSKAALNQFWALRHEIMGVNDPISIQWRFQIDLCRCLHHSVTSIIVVKRDNSFQIISILTEFSFLSTPPPSPTNQILKKIDKPRKLAPSNLNDSIVIIAPLKIFYCSGFQVNDEVYWYLLFTILIPSLVLKKKMNSLCKEKVM